MLMSQRRHATLSCSVTGAHDRYKWCEVSGLCARTDQRLSGIVNLRQLHVFSLSHGIRAAVQLARPEGTIT